MSKRKVAPLTVIIKSITQKTELLSEDYINKNYVPFITNKLLAQYQDCIYFTCIVDKMANMPLYAQYLFYYYAISKRNRFKRMEQTIINPDVKIIMDYYNYSHQKAVDIVRIISTTKMNEIRILMTKGT